MGDTILLLGQPLSVGGDQETLECAVQKLA